MKYKNEIIVFIAIVLTLTSLGSNFYVLQSVEKETVQTTGKAITSVSNATICLNHKPYIDFSNCSPTFTVNYSWGVLQTGEYNCTLNFTDVETGWGNLTVWDNSSIFNTTLLGDISFLPIRSMVGTITEPIYVQDTQGCGDSIVQKDLVVDILYANIPPWYVQIYPNSHRELVLQQYFSTFTFSLDNFFDDPNGDVISYDYVYLDSFCYNIALTIDNVTHTVRYSPGDFTTVETGPCRAYFVARDDYGGVNQSGVFNITVEETFIEEEPPEPPQSGGGGGGGGARPQPDCVLRNVTCTNWTECMYHPPPNDPTYEGLDDGIKTRECQWYTNCPGEMKPAMTQKCDYIPTCKDGILNQKETDIDCGGPNCPPCPTCDDGVMNGEEEGVDCGGPCEPCPTCYDDILNQGEEGVDCGGPCTACPTCEDGIWNQGEEGVDCGGPCPDECVEEELAAILAKKNWMNWLLILLALVLVSVLVYRYHDSLWVSRTIDKIRSPRSLLDKMVEPFTRAVYRFKSRKQERYKAHIQAVLTDFTNMMGTQGKALTELAKSSMFTDGLKLLSMKKAVSATVMKSEDYSYAFGTNRTINLSVSLKDAGIIREVLIRLHTMKPRYRTGVRISSYAFKADTKQKEALSYEKIKEVLVGIDKQINLSIIPRSRREEKSIISTIKGLLRYLPKEQLVWRYNNMHLFTPGKESGGTGLLFNVKESAEKVLIIPAHRKIKGYESFKVEVESW